MSIVTMDKKYRYEDNDELERVLCIDRSHQDYPVVSVGKSGVIRTHKRDGCYYSAGGKHEYNLIEISPYDHIKIDDKVLVWDDDATNKRKRHFAGVSADGYPLAFCNGVTSWVGDHVMTWRNCEKVND